MENIVQELMDKGGPMIWPLLVCSIISLMIVLERTLFWIKDKCNRQEQTRETFLKEVTVSDKDKACEKAKTSTDPIIHFMIEGVKNIENPTLAMEISSRETIQKMNRNLSVLDVMVTIAPILGILGTVLGIIDSFDLLGQRGVQDPHAVTGGVARALLSTAAGLGVAIMAVVPAAFFKSCSKHKVQIFEIMARRLLLALGKKGE